MATGVDVVKPLAPRQAKTAKQILKSVISASTQNLLADGTTAEDLLTVYTQILNPRLGSPTEVVNVFADLDFVPDGMFRSFVIAGAYESYIQPHAKREVPVVSNVERAQLKLYVDEVEMDEATALLQQISLDALELVRESFAAFLKDRGPYGFRETRLNKGTLPNFPYETQGEQREILEDLLEHPSSCRAFREYFQRIGGCPEYMFLVDVLDYKDTVQALHHAEKHQLHVGYTMRKLRKIYNKYLKHGSKAMIHIQERLRESILLDIAKNPIPSVEVFDIAMNSCSYVVILDHLNLFLQSPEYEASKSRRVEPEIHDYFVPTNGLPTLPVPSLPVMVAGSGSKYFRSYLRDQGVESTMDFYLEIEQFKLLPHNKKGYIAAIAGKIFKKYICRGAKLEVYLPSHIRRNILQDIADPQDSTFNEACEYVLGLWERKYLKQFRATPWFNDMHLHFSREQKSLDGSERQRACVSYHFHEPISQNAFRDLLAHENSVQMTQFHKFLVKESCASYLLFYSEIEEFKRLPKSDYLTRQAKKIFYRFLHASAKESVCLSTATITEFNVHMENPSPAMFRTAQEEVLQFLWKVLYPKFMKSPFFCDLATIKEIDKASIKADGRASKGASMLRKGTVVPSMMSKRESAENLLAPQEVTITAILANQDTRAMLLAFCEEIYCAESLYFWLECNEYKSIPHVDYLRVRAQKIYRKYITDSAKLQVNLVHAIVRDIEKSLAAPSRTLFIKVFHHHARVSRFHTSTYCMQAQEAIVFMMGKDTLPKFKASKFVQMGTTDQHVMRRVPLSHGRRERDHDDGSVDGRNALERETHRSYMG
ncbi:hypothetical protein DYB30_002332 [Aphanomyces astaci]|uniref:RGS domain-containing protein n=1 Tax=Aphanomyces astaci TaxID=112090 RepID=A0A397CWD6_APHAT|nr:hypothetical protein DYB30_002332 [Aphanomyces astaci]RHY60707.1 hypothetical protein DYB34_002670 [Aphanomyces astaci]